MEIFSRFTSVEKIKKGMSADEKYKVTTEEGKTCLLRVSKEDTYGDKELEFRRMKEFHQNKIPVPDPIEFGRLEDVNKVYSLTSWVEGKLLEKELKKRSRQEQYAFGLTSGEILRRVHLLGKVKMERSWGERYFEVMTPRLDAFIKEGIHFEGDRAILDYIESKKGLLDARPQTMLHGDYHMGNMILSESGEITVIDWEKVDFDSIGDPWYEFNRIGTEYPAFAKGQIDGYFSGNIPEEFWELLALYLSAGAITSIVWAKYCASDKMGEVMALNQDVLLWFQNMKSPVPLWYEK